MQTGHSAAPLATGAVLFLCKKRNKAKGQKTRFLKKVCQLDNFTASPKQPQSCTGSKIARIKVKIVKKDMNRNIPQAAIRLRKSSRTMTPSVNSTADSMMPQIREKGSRNPIPKAWKYSLKINDEPTGSTAFTKPENTKSSPSRILEIFLMAGRVLYVQILPATEPFSLPGHCRK
ncbi:MAG: hypothetical protein BWX93_01977 [Bacteroidetes bacterium ADurb.Bin139]|nr:MAG: hypothetical protein BWX93_01977 [Bacteroidetes bacterium ADurb.Bin139]